MSWLDLKNKPYGTQVILLLAFMAFGRVVIAILIDLTRDDVYWVELLTDGSLLILFGGLLIIGLRKVNLQSIHWIFGVLITLLLALNFFQFGGVEGSSRFNYYSCFFISILLYEKRELIGMLIFQAILLLAISSISFYRPEWVSDLIVVSNPDPTDFIFMLPALGILTYYLKSITVQEINQLDKLNGDLNTAVKEAKEVNLLLIKSSTELNQAQKQLSSEISRRTRDLDETKKAIETYIQMNTSDLTKPLHQLNNAVDVLPNETLTTLLLASTQELNQVIKNIHKALESEEEMDRNKISSK